MEVLRTPDERFVHLPGYDFAPHYVEINHQGASLRMHTLTKLARIVVDFIARTGA